MGMAMHDRFEAKHIKKSKKDKKGGEEKDGSKNEMKSSKFFSKLQEVVKQDQAKKDSKRKAREENVTMSMHNNQSTKKFKL